MILQFSFLFYYVCAKSSILSITAISLFGTSVVLFDFNIIFTIVDNFQHTEIKSNE